MELNIAICDDSLKHASLLESQIYKIFESMSAVQAQVEVYQHPLSFMEHFSRGLEKYHIIMLDIEMPDMNGIAVARRIRAVDPDVLIIYVTSHDSYMKESFEVHPFRYISKPVVFDELNRSVCQAFDYILNNSNLITFSSKNVTYQLRIKEIHYITMESGRKLRIITDSGEVTCYGKLSNLEQEMQPYYFSRVHTGYLVNMNSIRSLNSTEIVMSNRDIVPVSRGRREQFMQEYHRFIEKRLI
ncbi:LytR/AlgR family response regulator transcription factor [Paenibacillus sp. FSL R7-0331]|uniref:LytR/AlgR family response regulator transcription factor n=1 Tax=Paenibacillus sp. FSL R7-0331 TaxID=1536773 RepID=UPI0004F5D212|nr:LytTR family DNA-binding domain-containing protein [Paenibacillus sp. FSL R7-0331]AIQ53901.1 hypothetical protein R70331_21785 [Paenibacillus sp. FSL R7-0331]